MWKRWLIGAAIVACMGLLLAAVVAILTRDWRELLRLPKWRDHVRAAAK